MTHVAPMPMFQSSRRVATATPAGMAVISLDADLAESLRAALADETPGGIDTLLTTLPLILAAGADGLSAYRTALFHHDPKDAGILPALRELHATAPGTRFLAMTAATLSLAEMRQLLDAGVEDILPLTPVEPVPEPVVAAPNPENAPRPFAYDPPPKQGAILAVSRARGGVGATTVAVNLAIELAARKGARVLLLDLDLQHGDAAFYLDVEDQGALAGMIRNGTTPDQVFLQTAVIEHKSGLHILPAPAEMAPLTALTPEVVAGLLEALQAQYDHVVIDMPQAVVDWIAPVLARAAKVLIVTDTSVPAIRQTRRLIAAYTEDQPLLPVEVIVNSEAKSFLASSARKQAAAALERPLLHWIPRDEVTARRAIDRGTALAKVSPRAAITRALRDISARVLADLAAARSKA